MAIICFIFTIGLAIAAYREKYDRTSRIFFTCCALLNLFGGIHMIATGYPYAFKLAPNPADEQPDPQTSP